MKFQMVKLIVEFQKEHPYTMHLTAYMYEFEKPNGV